MRHTGSKTTRWIAGILVMLGAGCTLINSFDDVRQPSDGTYGEGKAPPDGSVSLEGGPAPGGAIIVGGEVESDGDLLPYILTVLNPTDGTEIGKRESMVVSAIRYDGLRDLWFIFENATGGNFTSGAYDKCILHVRTLDLATGKWTELSKLDVPPPRSNDSIGVLRERLGYVAAVDPDGGTLNFVTLDTSDPAKVSVVNQLPLAQAPIGVTGTRSTTGVGGTANIVQLNTGNCDANFCSIEERPVLVPNSGSPILRDPIAMGFALRTAFTSYASFVGTNPRDIVLFPRTAADAAAPSQAMLFDPVTKGEDGLATNFFINDSVIRPAAVSECARVTFVVGANSDLNVHAIPIPGDGGGTPTKVSTGHSGQSVYFEPSTATVLAPFNQGGGFDFSAFRLKGTSDAPTLEKRDATDWRPPKDLRPVVLGIREPLPIVCK